MPSRGLEVGHKDISEHSCLSPRYSMSLTDGGRSTRVLLVDWDDIPDARKQLLGYSWVDGTGNDAALHRRLPAKHPKDDWLVATAISDIQGVGKVGTEETEDGVINTYPKAKLQVEYAAPLFKLKEDDEVTRESDRFTEVEMTIDGSYLSVPNYGRLYWGTGATPKQPIPGAVGRIVPAANYCLKWHAIPFDAIPEDAIFDCMGCVNKYTFLAAGNPQLTFPAGTLLFLGGNKRLHFQPDGTLCWTAEYHFQYAGNPGAHNFLVNWHLSPPDWQFVSSDGNNHDPGDRDDGIAIYNERDLNDLFRVAG